MISWACDWHLKRGAGGQSCRTESPNWNPMPSPGRESVRMGLHCRTPAGVLRMWKPLPTHTGISPRNFNALSIFQRIIGDRRPGPLLTGSLLTQQSTGPGPCGPHHLQRAASAEETGTIFAKVILPEAPKVGLWGHRYPDSNLDFNVPNGLGNSTPLVSASVSVWA